MRKAHRNELKRKMTNLFAKEHYGIVGYAVVLAEQQKIEGTTDVLISWHFFSGNVPGAPYPVADVCKEAVVVMQDRIQDHGGEPQNKQDHRMGSLVLPGMPGWGEPQTLKPKD